MPSSHIGGCGGIVRLLISQEHPHNENRNLQNVKNFSDFESGRAEEKEKNWGQGISLKSLL